MNNYRGAVLLVTHKRRDTLEKVIDSLECAWIDQYKRLIVIHHVQENLVLNMIKNITFTNPDIISVDRSQVKEPKEAINRNIFEGLDRIFSDPEIAYVTVVEDDIEISRDFLEFNSSVMEKEIANPEFQGINGFSGAVFNQNLSSNYGKFKFGFGWGWTIPRKTWKSLEEHWSTDFTEHWDALVESRVRCGFVVMPHNSRILNLGVGSSATHTFEGSPLIDKLKYSFQDIKIEKKPLQYSFRPFSLNWRKDATIYVDPKKVRGKIIQSLCLVAVKLDNKLNLSPLERRLNQKLKGIIFRFIQVLSVRP